MLYVKNKLAFFHIPKTGGSWFILNMVKNCKEEGVFYGSDLHFTREMFWGTEHWQNIEKLKTVVFVRRPFDWYLSFWRYRNRTGWNTDNTSWFSQLAKECASMKFEGFLLNVLTYHPGFLTKFYASYLGQDFSEINYIIKQENLLDGCCKMLKLQGVKFDEVGFRDFPRNNVSDKTHVPCSSELKSRICETEKTIVERFNYKEIGK